MRYYQHFGLKGPLFRIVTPSQPLYMGSAHQEAFAALEWGLCYEPSGLTLLIGDPGTGKTTLLHSLLTCEHYQIRKAIISNPALLFDELLREVLRQLGIGAGPSRLEMLKALDSFVATVEPGGRAVIIIDEAQALSDAALEEIRLLSNSRAFEEKRLHFILVGQPELARRLCKDGLVPLNERIGARALLERLSRAESFEYVEYLLRAGGGNARKVFERRALARIVDHGAGVPRRLNVLCHNAMLLAYSANRRKVALRDACTAADEYRNFFAIAPSPQTAQSVGKRRWPWHANPKPQSTPTVPDSAPERYEQPSRTVQPAPTSL